MHKGSFLNDILLILFIFAPFILYYAWKACREQYPRFNNWCNHSKIYKAIRTLLVVAVVAVVLLTGTVVVWFIPLMFFLF